MQTTSVSTIKVVEKRSATSSVPQKPGTQVVDKRTHKTTTVTSSSTKSPSKPATQVVNNRSQNKTTTTTTIKTTVTTSKPASQVQVVTNRSQKQTTTKTSVSPSKPTTQAQVVNNRSHKTVPVKVTTTSHQSAQVVDKRSQKSTSKPTSNAPSKPDSKAPSKAPSQAPTKKVEVKKQVYSTFSDDDKIKEAFELFDSNDGRIDAAEVKDAMQNIGYDEKNPVVYQVVSELDNPRNKSSGGATFDDFCQTINYRIPEKETEEELRKIFELFVEPNSETTTLESIKRVADEIGANIEEGELRAMLNKASKSGAELTFEDFVAIMKDNL